MKKRHVFYIVFGISAVLATALTLVMFFLGVFNHYTDTLDGGNLVAFLFYFIAFFLLGFSHVTSSVMRGLGKPVVPMAVMLICWCAVRVIAIMLLGDTFHSIAFVSWLYPITWGLSSIAYIIQYIQIRRERALEA